MSKPSDLTAERLRELFNYDPETGVFRRRVTCSNRRAGEVAGSFSHGYLRIGIDGRDYLAHRLAWLHVHGVWPAGEVDHRNQTRDDNRIDNLREATHAQNGWNAGKRSHNASGFKGVSFDKRDRRWVAEIRHHGKRECLGYFDTPEEAHAAYVEAAHRLHGEFARAA